MAAKFALGGDEVTVIDMGPHLAAIQKGGIKLEGMTARCRRRR